MTKLTGLLSQETIEVLFEAGVVLEKLSVRELVETDNQEVVTQLLYHGLKPDAEVRDAPTRLTTHYPLA